MVSQLCVPTQERGNDRFYLNVSLGIVSGISFMHISPLRGFVIVNINVFYNNVIPSGFSYPLFKFIMLADSLIKIHILSLKG